MRVIRTEEMQRLDVNDVRHELAQVRDEKKRMGAYEDDLEVQLGKLLRNEVNPKPPAEPDPGPREKFLSDTKGMHLSDADRKLQLG